MIYPTRAACAAMVYVSQYIDNDVIYNGETVNIETPSDARDNLCQIRQCAVCVCLTICLTIRHFHHAYHTSTTYLIVKHCWVNRKDAIHTKCVLHFWANFHLGARRGDYGIERRLTQVQKIS